MGRTSKKEKQLDDECIRAKRKEKLMAVVCEDMREVMEITVDKMVYLENRMEELEKLPFIRVNPGNPQMQKATPASKMYKEYFQQYLNAVKVLEKAARSEDKTEISPLREWAQKRKAMLE